MANPMQFNTDVPPYNHWRRILVGQKALVTGANSGIGRAGMTCFPEFATGG